jgi:hypothetical protein
MKTFICEHKKLNAVVGAAVIIVTWLSSDSIEGYFDASFDVARGHYELKTYGLPADWAFDYYHLLRERYGIKVNIAGCTISSSIASYSDAYNALAMTLAVHKFGHDIFIESADEARKTWEQKRVDGTKSNE